jgi:poly(glycerol-phosphate) alpha-glucosyltransferase
MHAVFVNTFYAHNLSGASFAVDRRLQLFLNHNIAATVISADYYLTNRYYFHVHFPDLMAHFLDLHDILTANLDRAETDAWSTFYEVNKAHYEFDMAQKKATAENGTYFRWHDYDDGRLMLVHYYSNRDKLLRSDEYDWRGYLAVKVYYASNPNDGHNYVVRREHLNPDQQTVLTYHFTSDNEIRRIDWRDNYDQIHYFNQKNDLLLAALKYYTTLLDDNVLMVLDLFHSDTMAKLQPLNDLKRVRLIIQLHNIQVKDTLDGTPIRIGYSYPVLNSDKYSGLVVLTERQRQDVLAFAAENKVFAIAENWYDKHDIATHDAIEWSDKEDGLVIISARYDKTKQIDHAIKAVVTAHNRVKKIHLEIWGGGSDTVRKELQQLIDTNHANEYIQLKGITDNQHMKERLAQAQLHVLVSKNEGLPMVFFEAQMGKTPSISYDIDYGPDEIITNRINGDLIAANDVTYLASRMIELFENEGTLAYYAENSNQSLIKFSEDTIWQKWEKLIKQVFA